MNFIKIQGQIYRFTTLLVSAMHINSYRNILTWGQEPWYKHWGGGPRWGMQVGAIPGIGDGGSPWEPMRCGAGSQRKSPTVLPLGALLDNLPRSPKRWLFS